MFHRLPKPLKTQSFFLFGARGTGKSTFIKSYLREDSLYLDLLKDEVFDQLLSDKGYLERQCQNGRFEWIILDEVQRIPRLLNLCQRMIEEKKQKFALTGSSGRKIKRGAGNLLAGRAFLNVMHPLTITELGDSFDLMEALAWGTLPKIFSLKSDEEKRAYLRSYFLTYIKEEIVAEQVIRKLGPFRDFLGVRPRCRVRF